MTSKLDDISAAELSEVVHGLKVAGLQGERYFTIKGHENMWRVETALREWAATRDAEMRADRPCVQAPGKPGVVKVPTAS